LVVCTAVLFAFLVDLGCGLSSSCTGVARLRPLLMFLVPMLYGIFALLYLEARQKRAAQDPAWAGKAPQVGSRLAVVLSVVLLAGLALVGTCFGLVLWWPK
ncbi:MAG: hypothetical protein QOI63_382, partial [Thermoplasmata archaeon]|nr:hypothetical protein [Thermoplasmata archaeon]